MDGFITLLDRANDTRRTFASLCNDGIEISNGTARYSAMLPIKKRAKKDTKSEEFYFTPIGGKSNNSAKETDIKKAIKEYQAQNFFSNWFNSK
jgi:hypothetical protein